VPAFKLLRARCGPTGSARNAFPPICSGHLDICSEAEFASALRPDTPTHVLRGGIGLVLARRFEVGTLLDVDLVNPGSGSPRCLLARVTHVTVHAAGEWLVGLALLRKVREDELPAWGAEPARPEGRPDGDQPRDAAAPAVVADPGLARVCAAWPALPEHIQAAIRALAATAR
jgi:hypothetical protein